VQGHREAGGWKTKGNNEIKKWAAASQEFNFSVSKANFITSES